MSHDGQGTPHSVGLASLRLHSVRRSSSRLPARYARKWTAVRDRICSLYDDETFFFCKALQALAGPLLEALYTNDLWRPRRCGATRGCLPRS